MNKMRITIPTAILERIEEQAAETYPEECCGVLIGSDNESVRKVMHLSETKNVHDENRTRRFMIGPDDFIKAEKFAREKKAEIIGFYHSHPDNAAVPSEHDRDFAWPWYLYLIASVLNGKPSTMQAWKLRDDRKRFDEIQITIS